MDEPEREAGTTSIPIPQREESEKIDVYKRQGYRPFGFLPDPNDCHKLILDPVASQYVRLIFELALQGNRTGTIAKILNEKKIPTPAAYHVAENHVYSEQKAWDLQRSHWTSGTVYHVLKNEKYKMCIRDSPDTGLD